MNNKNLALPAILLLTFLVGCEQKPDSVSDVDWDRYTLADPPKLLHACTYTSLEDNPEWEQCFEAASKSCEPEPSPGADAFASNGCAACHSTDGSTGIGPTLKGLYGSQRVMEDGTTLNADETYIRSSLTKPYDQVVKDFPPVMAPVFNESEIEALVDYIKQDAYPLAPPHSERMTCLDAERKPCDDVESLIITEGVVEVGVSYLSGLAGSTLGNFNTLLDEATSSCVDELGGEFTVLASEKGEK